MTTFRILALLPALALSPVSAWAQAEPADAPTAPPAIVFGVEPLSQSDPAPAAPADGAAAGFVEPEPLPLPELSAPLGLAGGPEDGPDPGSVPANTVASVEVPEDWTPHAEYGLRFALPPDFAELERDAEEDGEIMLAIGTLDMQARSGVTYNIGFLSPSDVAAIPEEIGEQFGTGPLQASADPVVIDGVSWVEYMAQTDAADLGGFTVGVAMRILIAEHITDYGMSPVLMMVYFAEDRADHIQTERVFLGSMQIDPDWGTPAPVILRDGAVSYQVPPGGRLSGGISETERWIKFEEGRVDYARVVVSELGTRDWAAESFLRSEFNGPVDVVEGTVDGVAVWFVTGRPAFDLSAGRTADGDAWRVRAFVTQLCPAGRGPIALEAITTTDRIEGGLTLEGLLAPARLHLEDAARCPDPVFAAFAEVMEQAGPGQAPGDGPVADPAPQDPGAGAAPAVPSVPEPQPQQPSGKPTQPVVGGPQPPQPSDPSDPATPPSPVESEAQAWADAERAQTPAAMLAYLAAWPQGLHADRARDWLAARAIMAPGAAPATPANPADPEAQAWANAERAQTPAAMLAYLAAWPQGSHADQARDWLAARAIMAPGAAPTAPPAVPAPKRR